MNDSDALLAIQELLDGTVWTHDTLKEIAEIMEMSGYRIRDKYDRDRGACILTADNMHTADDCTLHDHE